MAESSWRNCQAARPRPRRRGRRRLLRELEAPELARARRATGDAWPTQAAAIPYRVVAGRVEVLLVTTRAGRWTLPKGGIEPGASAEETAATEALEEAGVVGRVEPTVGELTLEKDGRTHRVRVFPLRVATVLDRWEEERVRRRVWIGVAEVARFVERRALVQLVAAFRHRHLATGARGVA